jgi:hypothetical protein
MWVEKHNRWIEKNSVRVFVLVSASLCFAPPASAQCAGKSGFALQACQVASATGGSTNGSPAIPPSVLQGSKEPALTTGLADAIHPDTLPGTLQPDAAMFTPLMKLDRSADGSFMLRPGMYEAYVQSFSLDASDSGGGRVAAFYPAPCCKGRRAAVIGTTLKYSELHPDISQNDIQQLLWAVVAGTDLEKMSPAAQQAAVKILPNDLAKSLQGPVETAKVKQSIMGYINNRISKSPSAKAGAGAATSVQTVFTPAPAQVMQQNSGTPALPVERGVWAQILPGGFFVRYLPDGASKIRLQVIVPDALKFESTAPLLFDPTQYLAVYTQSPALRLGVSLRAAK